MPACRWRAHRFASLAAPVPLGIIAGLFVGKQIGVFGAVARRAQARHRRDAAKVRPAQLYGVAILTGIGFTMSLFIGTLAFEDEGLLTQIRLGVLAASILAGAVAALVLGLAARR